MGRDIGELSNRGYLKGTQGRRFALGGSTIILSLCVSWAIYK